MSEVVTTVAENLPYLGAFLGAAAGVGYDLRAQHKIETERKPISEDWGEAFADDRQINSWDRAKRVVASVGIIAACGALIGEAYAVTPEASGQKAIVKIVADRSGATYGLQADRITGVVKTIDQDNNINCQVFNARVDVAPASSCRSASTVATGGDGLMPEAFQNAKGAFEGSQASQARYGKDAIVVATAGHGIGSANEVVNSVKSLESKVEVDIVNVNPNIPRSEVAAFQQIAAQTGGKYIESPTEEQISSLVGGLEPPKTKPENHKSWPLRGLETFLGLLGIALYASRRRHLPLTWRGYKQVELIKGEEI